MYEFGRLVQGIKHVVLGTDMMRIIHRSQVTDGRKFTYAHFLCNYQHQMSEPYRCPITVCGDHIDYTGEVKKKTEYLTTLK